MNLTLHQRIAFALWVRIHALPRFFIERWQLQQLRRIVSLAWQGNPMYQKLWEKRGARQGGIKTRDDLYRLSVVDKNMFRNSRFAEAMTRPLRSRFAWNHTSGSTGEPFRFPISPLAMTRNDKRYFDFNSYRFLLWRGFSLDYIQNHMRVAWIGSVVKDKPRYVFISVKKFRDDPTGAILAMRRFTPDVLSARPSILAEMARMCRELPVWERPRPRFIISRGEMLLPAQRQCIKEMLGGEVYDHYGLEEMDYVAAECAEHNGLHVYDESFILEILDDNGQVVPDGVMGRIVATYFYNDIMPFIRYDTGDRGVRLRTPCPCGVSAPLIKVLGRTRDFISLGARRFHASEVDNLLRHYGSFVLRYQVAKTEKNKLELRIIPTAAAASGRELPLLRKKFVEELGFVPEIKVVSAISFTDRGKTPVFIDETEST